MEKFKFLRAASIVLLILFFHNTASGSEIERFSLKNIAQKSEFIFEGRVVSKQMRLSQNSGKPFTYFTFEVIDVIKGDYSKKSIELGFMGGEKDGFTLEISDLNMPGENEWGIYFVESLNRLQINPFYGWDQGHYLWNL